MAQNDATSVLAVAIGVLTTALLLYHRSQKEKERKRKKVSNLIDEECDEVGGLGSLLLTEEDRAHHQRHDSGKKCIYLDYNATTPIRDVVVSAMIPYLTVHYGNPSSSHYYGEVPKVAVKKARIELAKLLLLPSNDKSRKADDNDDDVDDALDSKRLDEVSDAIVFTGCGTEADNLAIHLALNSFQGMGKKKHVVTSNVEHPAVMECLKFLEGRGEIEVTYVEVNEEGLVSYNDVINAIRGESTCLVTIMLANNESGAVMPVCTIAAECRRRGVLFHTDAAQAVGKIDVNVDIALGGSDMVTIVGHKFGGPKGVAALYIRPGCLSEYGRQKPDLYGTSGALLLGGGQEQGRRAGTENVPYIVAMGRAASLVSGHRSLAVAEHMERMRERLLNNLIKNFGANNIRVNGPKDKKYRLPNTLSIGLRNVHGGELLSEISQFVAASAGSACHASGGNISSILTAMHVPAEFARGTLRLSVGIDTSESDVDKAAEIVTVEAKRQLESQLQR